MTTDENSKINSYLNYMNYADYSNIDNLPDELKNLDMNDLAAMQLLAQGGMY